MLDTMDRRRLLCHIFRIDLTDQVGNGDDPILQLHFCRFLDTGAETDDFIVRFHQVGNLLYLRILLHQQQRGIEEESLTLYFYLLQCGCDFATIIL